MCPRGNHLEHKNTDTSSLALSFYGFVISRAHSGIRTAKKLSLQYLKVGAKSPDDEEIGVIIRTNIIIINHQS